MKKIFLALFLSLGLLHAADREDFLKDQVCNLLPSLEGWCSREKALNFIELVLEMEPDVCVEIGAFGGASVFPVASDFNYVLDAYCTMLKRFGLNDFCITIKTTSEKAAMCLKSIDILHIDGSRDERVSAGDVQIYLPLVRSGGYVWINDALWPERQLAIGLLKESCDLIKTIDNGNCILFKKR
jgi:hypothetical protein